MKDYKIAIFFRLIKECPQHNGREVILGVIEMIRDWSLPPVHLLVISRNKRHTTSIRSFYRL